MLAARTVMAKQMLADLVMEPSMFVGITKGFALLTLIPVWCWFDLTGLLQPGAWKSKTIGLLLLNSFVVALGANSSTTVLTVVSPVSHSVLNSLKRVFVIAGAVIYFRNVVRVPQLVGIIMALYGAHLYSAPVQKKLTGSEQIEIGAIA